MGHITELAGTASTLVLGRAPRRDRGAVVLAYHDVRRTLEGATEYTVTASQLRHHVRWMQRWGYEFTTLDEIVDRLIAGGPLDGLAAVTFDDGLVGVREHALGILAELGVPGTAFVVTDVRGVVPPFWPQARRTMTTEELRELDASGITLASHTRHHCSLPELDPQTRADELAGSRAALEDLLGRSIDLMAYPSGHQDAAVRADASSAGYRAACTFTNGRVRFGDDPFQLARFSMTDAHHRLRLADHLARPATSWPQ